MAFSRPIAHFEVVLTFLFFLFVVFNFCIFLSGNEDFEKNGAQYLDFSCGALPGLVTPPRERGQTVVNTYENSPQKVKNQMYTKYKQKYKQKREKKKIYRV